MIWAEVWNLLFVRKLLKNKFLFVCVKGKSEAEIQTDTDDFLPPLRRLSPPPPANSHAETACSDTLTEAGYARCANENQPTVLSWILLPDLPHLLDGTVCHACTQADDIIFVMSHAQIYIEQRMTRKLKSSINYFRFWVRVKNLVEREAAYSKKELLHCCTL